MKTQKGWARPSRLDNPDYCRGAKDTIVSVIIINSILLLVVSIVVIALL